MTVESDVRSWIEAQARRELAETGFTQVDIDDLLDPPPTRAAAALLDCMRIAVANTRAEYTRVGGLVVIPLAEVEGQSSPPTDHPALDDLLNTDWIYGPGREVPGLYLIRDGRQPIENAVEEYSVDDSADPEPCGVLPRMANGRRASKLSE